MTKSTEYAHPDGDAETRAYARIMAQAFAGPEKAFEDWALSFGQENVRVLRGAQLLGGLVIYRMGQFFGGRSVPTWGIAGVAIPPELRGKGHAREMMLANLRENFEHGPPISTLYPATTKLYRGLGWETAGSRIAYRVSCAGLPNESSPLEVRKATDADEKTIRRLYDERYASCNGCLDRNEAIWTRVKRAPEETPVLTYLVERDGVAEGYVSYLQKRGSKPGVVFDLIVRDLVALTGEAARKIIATFAAHRSVADELQFYGAPSESLLMNLLPSQVTRVHDRLDWMLRIVRVEDALEARGYSPHVNGEVNLRVADDVIEDNARDWTLKLENGEMNVRPGSESGPVVDIRGLAALFSSRQTPTDLRRAGLLNGDDSQDTLLAAMFAGPSPWMPDFF